MEELLPLELPGWGTELDSVTLSQVGTELG